MGQVTLRLTSRLPSRWVCGPWPGTMGAQPSLNFASQGYNLARVGGVKFQICGIRIRWDAVAADRKMFPPRLYYIISHYITLYYMILY